MIHQKHGHHGRQQAKRADVEENRVRKALLDSAERHGLQRQISGDGHGIMRRDLASYTRKELIEPYTPVIGLSECNANSSELTTLPEHVLSGCHIGDQPRRWRLSIGLAIQPYDADGLAARLQGHALSHAQSGRSMRQHSLLGQKVCDRGHIATGHGNRGHVISQEVIGRLAMLDIAFDQRHHVVNGR